MMRFVCVLGTRLSVLAGVVSLLRPRDRASAVLLMPLKLLAVAMTPLLGLVSALSALWALGRRDWKLAGSGIAAAGLAACFARDIPDSRQAFDSAFGGDWPSRVPVPLRSHRLSRRWWLFSRTPRSGVWQRDIPFGESPATGKTLLADLWQPKPGRPRSGPGVVYVHGGGWRIGYKDMLTRPLFHRLASQGHVVLDIEYTLWPRADIPMMVSEVRQAILWMKDSASRFGLQRNRIVLMGGSAGAHLALMTAYGAEDPALQPSSGLGDTSVQGVVAFYPPVDLVGMGSALAEHVGMREQSSWTGQVHRLAGELVRWVFSLSHSRSTPGSRLRFDEFFPRLVGGMPDEIPEAYRSLSPIACLHGDCPSTLLLQGLDDAFGLAPAVRRMHGNLRAAGIPSILVEFPHSEHAFDLVLPQISPVAQAATHDVERFLALLI